MKTFKTITTQKVITVICDGCGLQANADCDYEFHEFICIKHKCGYGSIHGDGKQIDIDLCQQCFADMCGDTIRVTDECINLAEEEESSEVNPLEYSNIFSAINQSKKAADALKQSSDFLITVRDILSVNKIATPQELQAALKRVEQLWDAQYHSAEGNELHTLADLICAYEKPDWDSFFEQVPLADEDFMPVRMNCLAKPLFEGSDTANGILKNIPINKDIDDDSSRQSAIDEENNHE